MSNPKPRRIRVLFNFTKTADADVLSSGLEALTITRGALQPLGPASIRRIDQGNTGQLLVKVASVAKAWSYELRYASLGAGGATGPWTYQPITSVASPTPCNGLTPGATYAFQVRALGRL